MCLWHRCMRHLSPQAIDSMQCQNLVKGLKISIPRKFDHICSSCANGKSHRFLFPNSSSTHYTKMKLVVMDITGLMSVPTWDGFLYALVIVKVSCRYPVGRLLCTKEDIGVTICDVLAMLERQSRLKVCCLCSNNGSEFVNDTMNTFCHHNGIIHETTIPYIPEQNRITKRAIVIFFEMVQSMLYTANISLRYWGKAFSYAVHIRSLSATTGLNGVVPYEAWIGRKPDVSHLQVFGLLGWTHIPRQIYRGKLKSQAVKVQILS